MYLNKPLNIPLTIPGGITPPTLVSELYLTKSSNQGVAAGTVPITWNQIDVQNSWAFTSGDSTVTVPSGIDYVVVIGGAYQTTSDTSPKYIGIRLNGSNIMTDRFFNQGRSPTAFRFMVPVSASDTLDMVINGTGSSSVWGHRSTFFSLKGYSL